MRADAHTHTHLHLYTHVHAHACVWTCRGQTYLAKRQSYIFRTSNRKQDRPLNSNYSLDAEIYIDAHMLVMHIRAHHTYMYMRTGIRRTCNDGMHTSLHAHMLIHARTFILVAYTRVQACTCRLARTCMHPHNFAHLRTYDRNARLFVWLCIQVLPYAQTSAAVSMGYVQALVQGYTRS